MSITVRSWMPADALEPKWMRGGLERLFRSMQYQADNASDAGWAHVRTQGVWTVGSVGGRPTVTLTVPGGHADE